MKHDKHIHFRKIALKRELSLWQTTMMGIGIIIGAGIYALLGKAAGMAGNGIWISFIVAAFVAALTGLSYAELSSIFPKAGAEYVYTKKAFGRRLAFLVGWLIIIGGIIASATVALGFAGYFFSLSGIPIIPVAIVIILLMSLIIFLGIKQSASVAIVCTIVEIAGVLLIIFVGLPYFGSIDYFEIPSSAGVLSAAALIFFAFIGFEEISRLSEETKKPTKTIPKALVLSIVITTIIYILVAVSAVSILGWQKLSSSSSPMSDVASAALGSDAFLMLTIIALFSTSNTVLLLLLATSRITYGMAQQRSLPKSFGRVSKKTRTPWVAIIIIGIFSLFFVFFEKIEMVANAANFTIFVTFAVINLSVIRLRYSNKKKRGFRVPLNIGKFPVLPLLGAAASLIMIAGISLDIIAAGIAIIIIGLLVGERWCMKK
ncbi:MAG TPA: APC family permease [archaeon]|nr:APC family permease [archaeon]